MIYDFYSFGGETRDPLSIETFKKDKMWNLQLFNARQAVTSLNEYQGSTVFQGDNEPRMDKLNIPSQDPKIAIVLDYHLFRYQGCGKVKPIRLLETCSRWNEEFDAQIYICAYVQPLSDKHAKLLARFDDPAFQRVFEGLFVVPVASRKSGQATIANEVFTEILIDEGMQFMYADRHLDISVGSSECPHQDRIKEIERSLRVRLLDENTTEKI